MAYNITKYYRNISGLDLRVSDLLRDAGAATEATNIEYRQTGALSKRKGFQIKTDSGVGGAGLIKFNNVEIGTGTITEELLAIDDNLEKYTEQTFTIVYSGGTSAYYNLYLDTTTSTFKFDLYEDNSLVFSQDLGTGQGASDTTIAQLKTLVDAESGFAMTITDAGSTPAAYAELGRVVNIASSPGTDTNYYTWTTVDSPGTYSTPFSAHWAIKDNADFEIASSAQMLEVLYIANGYDDLHKYDGNRVYKAGVPQPTIPTDGVGAGGSLTAGAYDWKYTYEHTDAKQNIVVGQESDIVEFTSAGSDSRNITLTNLTAGSGYGVAQATVNGAQSGVTTITVNSGHDLKVNDQVYIDDGVSGLVVKRGVTATTATTITIDGAAVNVGAGDSISQTKLQLWRTKSGGTIFYLVKEFVNDTGSGTTVYDDGTADSSLVEEKIDPVKVPGLPPKCRYIDVWRGQVVMTGNRDNVNTVYYSDFDGESFPLDQSFLTEARLGGGNSGIKSLDNALFVFKPRSVITVTGDLGTDNFQVDALADDGVGCVAHATIKEIEGVLWFLGKRGVYTVNRQGTIKMSERIEPKFELNYAEKRCVAHYWIEKELYLVQMPFFLEDAGSEKYMDSNNSFIMVYDLYHQAWYQWNTINMTAGITEYNNEIYTLGFDRDPVTATSTTYPYKILDMGTSDDYADHQNGISFLYKSHWEALGNPSIYKKFLRMKVHALDGTIGDFETDKFTLNIETEHDYVIAAVSSFSLDFSGGSLGWGNSPWGEFIWGESRLEQMRSKLASRKAKSLRTVFKNDTAHENVLISGYELEISASFDLQIKE
jgi:hypothetical protein